VLRHHKLAIRFAVVFMRGMFVEGESASLRLSKFAPGKFVIGTVIKIENIRNAFSTQQSLDKGQIAFAVLLAITARWIECY